MQDLKALEGKSLAELREIAKVLGIKNVMVKKRELIEKIAGTDSPKEAPAENKDEAKGQVSEAAAEPVQGQGELSGYGLETPKKYVTATADGADSTICVGSQTSDGRWYVLTPDGVVRLAAQADGAALSRSIYDMAVLPELPAITEENLISLTLTGAEGKQVTFSVDVSGVRRSGARDVTEKTASVGVEVGTLAVTACVAFVR
ncbi:DUF4340 domain-containing protein, partial [Alistipes sp.]|uniref:DUF4340 domain-containing protein n=1 Tax=Alistipes sp. TaxID=1872444 RepID=UPI00307B8342